MAQFKETYSDGVRNIHFAGGMIRLDFVTFQPTGESGKPPVSEISERMIMSPQGFLELVNSAQQLTQKLAEAGVLQKAEQPKA